MTLFNPESLLLRVLQVDGEFIQLDAANEARHFIEVGECGLAYDVLVFEVGERKYAPSPEALELIKQSALAMGLVFPQLSTP